jgi:hypothetical protein
MRVFIRWGQNLFFKKIRFFEAITIKTASFLIQTVKFILKRSNLNSNDQS